MTPTQKKAMEMAITAIEKLQEETEDTFSGTFRKCCPTMPSEPHKYCELDDSVKALRAALAEQTPLFKPLIDQHPGLAEELAERADDKADDEPVDDYGNPLSGDRLINCCFPDCGCDGARLCMAENGPSSSAVAINIERGSWTPRRKP